MKTGCLLQSVSHLFFVLLQSFLQVGKVWGMRMRHRYWMSSWYVQITDFPFLPPDVEPHSSFQNKPDCGPAHTTTYQHGAGAFPCPAVQHLAPAASLQPTPAYTLRSGVQYQSVAHGGQQSHTWIPVFGWKFPTCVRRWSSSEHLHSPGAFGNHNAKN